MHHAGPYQNAMKKLQKQAHDALNKVHAAEEMAGIHTELERLGGKTHFICMSTASEKPCCRASDDSQQCDPLAAHAPSPTQANTAPTTVANPILQTSGTGAGAMEPPLQPDMIHRTIMEDMQRFDMEGFDGSDGTQFNMDFPPTVFDPRQAVDFSAFPELDFSVGLAIPGVGVGVGVGVGSSGDVWMNGSAEGMGMGMQGVNGMNGVDGMHGTGTNGVNGVNGLGGMNGHGASNPMGGASGPPVLDATWQALVEQLGF